MSNGLINHKDIMTRLLHNGFQAFIVGGAVRDYLLGKEPKDIDLATDALPGEVADLFKDQRIKFVGAHFGVMLVNGIEVATFREDLTNDTVQYVRDIKDDLARRDITINAMAMTIDGAIIDPYGGQSDLKEKRIRFVGDPDQRIKEDPVRMVRAIRFASSLDFAVAAESWAAMRMRKDLLGTVAKERLNLELVKILETSNLDSCLLLLYYSDLLKWYFPYMLRAVGHTGGKHHEETVFNHLRICGNSISKKYPLLRLVGILHDIGKPESYNSDEDTFIGHHKIGADMTRVILKDLKFSNDAVAQCGELVYQHMHCISIQTKKKSFRKLSTKLALVGLGWRDWVRVRIADHSANLTKKKYTITEIKNLVRMFDEEELPLSVHDLAMSGGELIQEFKLQQGAWISKLQKELLVFVLEHGQEFNNKDALLQYSRERML